MDIGKIKTENPELYETLLAEAKKAVEPEAREHAREALRTEFKEQLREESSKLREEAVEEARGELLEDPEVAGAATAIGRIKEVVAPFILDEDGNKELTKVRKNLAEAHATIAERDEKITGMEEENSELACLAKEFGYALHLERTLIDNSRKDQILDMLGDVSECESLNELKGRLGEILEALVEEDEKQQAYEEKIAELEAQTVKLQEERDQALGISHKFGIRALIERKVADHPHRDKLRNYLSESKPSSQEDVDRLVEAFTAANPISREFEKIRSEMGDKGVRGQRRSEPTDKDEGAEHLEEGFIHGVSMNELVKLAGETIG